MRANIQLVGGGLSVKYYIHTCMWITCKCFSSHVTCWHIGCIHDEAKTTKVSIFWNTLKTRGILTIDSTLTLSLIPFSLSLIFYYILDCTWHPSLYSTYHRPTGHTCTLYVQLTWSLNTNQSVKPKMHLLYNLDWYNNTLLNKINSSTNIPLTHYYLCKLSLAIMK